MRNITQENVGKASAAVKPLFSQHRGIGHPPAVLCPNPRNKPSPGRTLPRPCRPALSAAPFGSRFSPRGLPRPGRTLERMASAASGTATLAPFPTRTGGEQLQTRGFRPPCPHLGVPGAHRPRTAPTWQPRHRLPAATAFRARPAASGRRRRGRALPARGGSGGQPRAARGGGGGRVCTGMCSLHLPRVSSVSLREKPSALGKRETG